MNKVVRNISKLTLAAAIVASSIAMPARAVEANAFTSTLGVITGVPVGFFAGGVRGAHSKGVEYADGISQELGDGPIGNIIGLPVGLFVGGVAGGVTGLIKGVVAGVKVGISDPFTNESYSVDGDFMDFNPYEINL